ncbi:peroxidase-related enzyme [Maribacter algarum]|uniref:Peroxidase-related enzyme n=1 Tax=Maribacter algarum (ex Zhang et al. 2020) TaxID=2578118 RepID=A0A5S3PQ43_9FLAO|nr:peroxidase-related enzyme [Maribacter algarum]TMM56822.1 peroxidase-related enzyme [Maribacter algarum]
MSWIKTIDFDKAEGKLKSLYKRVKGPNNNVDNVLKIHSLRPHTLEGHMVLYKAVLHHSANTLPKWYLEALGCYVSNLNNCDYCFDHHFAGLQRLLNDDAKSNQFLEAVKNDALDSFLDVKFTKGANYAKKLTMNVQSIIKEDFSKLNKSGFSEGEILEINQVVSYFNYVNRSVIGLGANTKGDILGLSPNQNDDPDNWGHS